MESDSDCSLDIVRLFILSHGGKVRNPDLVARFRKFLNDPENKIENRSKFKDYVNTLATIKVDESGEKILRLKKRYLEESDQQQSIMHRQPTEELSASSSSSASSTAISRGDHPQDASSRMPFSTKSSAPLVERNNNTSLETPKSAKQSKFDSSINESVANMTVLERAKHLNKLQSESDILKVPSTKYHETKSLKSRDGDDDESSSVQYVSLSDDEREWLYTCCTADYHPIAKLLTQNPSLAKVKDFTNGYTALHWAAKHGKAEVIKLIAGKYEVNVDQKSHGGYTALHLAAMNGHEDIIELLVRTYGASPSIRDHSGKKAKQYLKISASLSTNQLLLAKKSGSNVQENSALHRNTNIRQSQRARAISSLLVTSSSIMKQPYFIGQTDHNDSGSLPGINKMKDTPTSSPSLSRKGSTRSEPHINIHRHSVDSDAILMPPPKVNPSQSRQFRASSADDITSEFTVLGQTSDMSNENRSSGSVFI